MSMESGTKLGDESGIGGVVTPSHLTGGVVTPSEASMAVSMVLFGVESATKHSLLTLGVDLLKQTRGE
jgi:hypothetical protein